MDKSMTNKAKPTIIPNEVSDKDLEMNESSAKLSIVPPTVIVENDMVVINGLRISSPDVVQAIKNSNDPDQLIKSFIELGLRARRLADNSVNEESVRNAIEIIKNDFKSVAEQTVKSIEDTENDLFDKEKGSVSLFLKEFRQKFEEKIDDSFDENNKESILSKFDDLMEERIEDHIDSMEKLLDTVDDTKPLGKLKKAVKDDIADTETRIKDLIGKLAEKLSIDLTEQEAKSKMTHKGGDLEDAVLEALNKICPPLRDLPKNTGKEKGRLGMNVGDLTVTINNPNAGPRVKVVWEAKCASKTIADIYEEVKRAKINREAQSGIAVFDKDKAPAGLESDFFPYDDWAIVVVDRNEVDLNLIKVAHLWSRFNALSTLAKTIEGIDEAQAKGVIERIRQAFDLATTIRTNHGTISRSVVLAERNLSGMIDTLAGEVAELEKVIFPSEANTLNEVLQDLPDYKLSDDEYQEQVASDIQIFQNTPPGTEREIKLGGLATLGDYVEGLAESESETWWERTEKPVQQAILEVTGRGKQPAKNITNVTIDSLISCTNVSSNRIDKFARILVQEI